MSSTMPDWTTPDFLSSLAPETNSAQSYVDQINSFLNEHPAGTIFPPGVSFDDGSSPGGSSSNGTPGSRQDLQITQAPAAAAPDHTHGRHDKRKSDKASAATLKDRRGSDGDRTHTHGDIDYAEGSDDDTAHPGKKGKNSDRRRAQNRQAQRNFRERKEKHLKDLEERVVSLEQQANDSMTENSALKQLVQQLQSENERLKVYQSAFSFSYDKDVSGSSSMPKAPSFGGAPLPPPPEHPRHSSVSSSGSSPVTHRSSSASEPAPYSAPTSLASSVAQTPTLATTSPTAGPAVKSNALDDALFMGTFAPSPASTTGESAGSSNHVATPPESNLMSAASSDLFRSYREPSMTQFDDLDALFASVAPLTQGLAAKTSVPGLSDVGTDDFSSFLKSPSPISAGLTPPSDTEAMRSTTSKTASLPMKEASAAALNAATAASGVCPFGDKVPEKFVFDVDELCADMKAKATCQEAARRALQEAMAQDAQTADKLFNQKSSSSVSPSSGA